MFFHEYWWILPIVIIIVYFILMRGRGICGCGSCDEDQHDQESARDILDKKYAAGEIDKAEYEEKKRTISN